MAKRDYRNESIAVLWDSSLCIHSGNCLRGAPEVFDTSARPWVNIEGADADHIAEVIARCPSGALHFERLDSGADETPDHPTTVRATRNGPLYLRGDVEILNSEGTVIRRDTRLSLCRCGHSENKPFCDDSHFRVGFEAD